MFTLKTRPIPIERIILSLFCTCMAAEVIGRSKAKHVESWENVLPQVFVENRWIVNASAAWTHSTYKFDGGLTKRCVSAHIVHKLSNDWQFRMKNSMLQSFVGHKWSFGVNTQSFAYLGAVQLVYALFLFVTKTSPSHVFCSKR